MNAGNQPNLAEPFSQIFSDRAEADWAFDLLLDTAKQLGVNGPYDSRFALTLTRRAGKPGLHLNFGGWLVLGFRGRDQVEMTLLAQEVAWDERFDSLPFERKEGEPEVRSYQLPRSLVKPLTSGLQTAFEATLAFVAGKFHIWQRATHWKQHRSEIIEALFDPAKRAELFAGGLDEPELLYERQLTAFYQDVSEEGEVYGVGESALDESSTNDLESSLSVHQQTVKVEDTRETSMKTVTVESLNGIHPEFQDALFAAMENCTNQERLLICLYFMSDLPDEAHHYREIENNLRSIFPPSLGSDNKKPDDYEDFQASVIRWQFGNEDRRVKQGQLSTDNRLWEQTDKGNWRNTPLGNRRAIEILLREGIQVEIIEAIKSKMETEELKKVEKPTTVDINPPYPLPHLAEVTGFDEAELNRWVRAIERKKQAILYGPPGTGKTFIAEQLAQHLIGGGDGFTELVQFHPAYAYEDFIQGIRPESEDSGLTYPVKPGRFLEFCQKAKSRYDTCVLIIDEINRANLARVFGELMYLLEYREKEIPLAGGGPNSPFKIPDNVRLIGTMNTADRSIALVDHALRRRFAFIKLAPRYEVLRRYHQQKGFPVDGLITLLKKLNREIEENYQVGMTFFLRENLAEEIEDIWRMEIEPYLEEYFFDQPDKVGKYRWEKVGGAAILQRIEKISEKAEPPE